MLFTFTDNNFKELCKFVLSGVNFRSDYKTNMKKMWQQWLIEICLHSKNQTRLLNKMSLIAFLKTLQIFIKHSIPF